jgi:hypothetical protein
MPVTAAPVEPDESAKGRQGVQREIISDQRFIGQLNHLIFLKQFLFEEKYSFKEEELNAIDLGILNNIAYGSHGRNPGASEWRLLDSKMSALASYLTDDLRKKIRIRELRAFFATAPLIFLFVSIASTIVITLQPLVIDKGNPVFSLLYLLCNISWSVSQGGLGACAFLGTSLIVKTSVDKSLADSTKNSELVDVTDRNFLRTRILLGALFGFLLGLPFTNIALSSIYLLLFSGGETPNMPTPSSIAIMLTPFVIGFSTNLVIVVLGRIVITIETFFGIPSKA